MSEIEFEAPGDPRIDERYRRISPMCFIAFAAGLVSLIALINVDMAALPILAAMFCVGVIVKVSTSGENVIGLRWAYFGLLLPFIALAAGFSYQQSYRQFINAKAVEFVDEWLNLVQQGEIHRPYELTLRFPDRQPSNVDLKAYYDNLPSDYSATKNNRHFVSYLTVEPEISLRREGKNCKIELEKQVAYFPAFRSERIRLQYLLTFSSTNEQRRIIIEIKRDNYPEPTGPQWTISNVFNTDPELPRKLDETGIFQ